MTKPFVPVLVVDDNASKRLALKAILSQLEYTIVEAASGRDALRAVMAQDFAVILMDVVMPGMDGFETAALVRERRQSHMTPIIFITAHGKDEIGKPDLYAEGAVDFIFAPVPANELRAKVSVFANLFIKAEQLASRAREVQVSADQLRLLTDAAPVGIFQTDTKNCYVYTNPRWSEITGIPAPEAQGRAWDTIIASGQRAGLGRLGDKGPEEAEVSHRFELKRPGSSSRVAVVTAKAIPDDEGGTAGWVGTLADVTAEAYLEAAMSDARDEATEASRLKSDFLANMSHEIRTPMNGVIGMAELLLETDLDARQRDYALTVHHSGEALLTIIDDILDFSKVEAGQLEVEEIEFDLRSTVEAVVALLAGSAQAKGLEMITAIENDVPALVTGDPGRVRQVLINLLGNAVKFTQAGEIAVRVGCSKTPGEETLIRFEVSDTGDGMAPEKLALVFEPFVQADTSTSRKYGGTGLGLAISRHLVELMGGSCGASSSLGEGSEFWFTVGAGAASTSAPPDGVDADLAGVRVLVADDNETQRGALSEYLMAWGMSVTRAGGAQEALSSLRAGAESGRPFALALLDSSMSAENGRDVKDEINADPSLTVQAVLMYELGQQRPSGTDPSLMKPIHLDDLRSCLADALGTARSCPTPSSSDPETLAGSNGHAYGSLLLAEDNIINQKVAIAMLVGAGYEVHTVANGLEAVDAVAHHPFDAILMDCQMPELTGYEATAQIRAIEGDGPRTPIIALTAGARPEDRVRCFESGMDDYLSKPVSKRTLLTTVARHVSHEVPDGVVLNETVVAELQAIGPDALSGLVSLYIDEARRQMDELSEAITRNDASTVAEVAHKLNGSSAALGVANVSRAADELETAARAGDMAAAGSLMPRLQTDISDARSAFASRPISPAAAPVGV